MAKKYKGSKVKTKVGDLSFVLIQGDGIDTASTGQEPNMKYIAILECDEGGEIHEHFKAQVEAEWERYKNTFGVKGRPAKNKYGVPMTGIAPKMVQNDAKIDPETGEGTWEPTGKVSITFKTNTTWADGKRVVVKVYNGKSQDITDDLSDANQSIGKGSRGIIHGTAQGNNAGDAHKVTLYLSAVQLAKFVPYDGTDVETEDIEGAEEINIVPSVPDSGGIVPEIDIDEDEIPFS